MEIPTFAKRFYALHIVEGLAAYPEQGENGKMILLREEALRKMDPTFSGKPVKFDTDHLTLEEGAKIARSANKGAHVEGVVNKSFFNDADGRHWCELLVWDPDALSVIERGVGVSNAYIINAKAPGGEYHAVQYDEEVMDGEYDHILITNSPRYEESKILTPEEFKAYNEKRKQQLALVTNSKENTMAFKLFERKPVEGFTGFEGKEVELPKSKKTVLVTNVLNAVDEQMAKEESGEMYANMDHKVKLHDNSICNVGELVERHKMAMEENSRLKNENSEWETAAGGKKEEGHSENESPEEKEKREKNEKEEKDKADKVKAEKEKMDNEKRIAIRNKVERLKGGPERAAASETGNEDDEYSQPVIRMQRDRVVNRKSGEA